MNIITPYLTAVLDSRSEMFERSIAIRWAARRHITRRTVQKKIVQRKVNMARCANMLHDEVSRIDVITIGPLPNGRESQSSRNTLCFEILSPVHVTAGYIFLLDAIAILVRSTRSVHLTSFPLSTVQTCVEHEDLRSA
jgi:hypothetical protein